MLQQLRLLQVCVPLMRMARSSFQCLGGSVPVPGRFILHRHFARHVVFTTGEKLAKPLRNANVPLRTPRSSLPLVKHLAIKAMRKRVEVRARPVGQVIMASALHESGSAGEYITRILNLIGIFFQRGGHCPHQRVDVADSALDGADQDVRDETGTVTNWNLELASPNVLVRNGWSRKSLMVGDEIVVEGSLAKDGSKMANARVVRLADGRRVFAGSSGGDAPPK